MQLVILAKQQGLGDDGFFYGSNCSKQTDSATELLKLSTLKLMKMQL